MKGLRIGVRVRVEHRKMWVVGKVTDVRIGGYHGSTIRVLDDFEHPSDDNYKRGGSWYPLSEVREVLI